MERRHAPWDFVPGLPLIEKLDEDVARYFKPDPKQLIGTERPDTCVRNLTEDGVRGFYSHLAKIAKESGGFLGLPISPGFNVRIWARPGTHEPRRGGETYKMGWRLASQFNPDWYLICSWNEWGEGTQIEPDCDFGTLYLDLTREMVRKYVRKA